MIARRPRRSPATQAFLYSGVLLLAWGWDAVASGHLQQQIARLVFGVSALAGGFMWLNRPKHPGDGSNR